MVPGTRNSSSAFHARLISWSIRTEGTRRKVKHSNYILQKSLKREGDNSVKPRYPASRIATETPPMRLSLMLFGLLLALIGAQSAHAVEKPKSSQTIWYERIEAGCKSDAKKYYSAIHFQKRRAFVKHCIDRAYR